MTIIGSNPGPRTSHGAFADLPSPTDSNVRGGDAYITTDNPAREFVCRVTGALSREWVEILTSKSAIWPKYVVNRTGEQPIASYTSIQAAIDAAVSDGHDTANPTVVHVFPGDYTEDLVFAPGVFVVSMNLTIPGGVVVTGNHLIPGDVPNGVYRINGLQLFGSAGMPALLIAGSEVIDVACWQSIFFADGAAVIHWTNTGAGSQWLAVDGAAIGGSPPAGVGIFDMDNVLSAGSNIQFLRFTLFAGDPFSDLAFRNNAGAGVSVQGGSLSGGVRQIGGTFQGRDALYFALDQPVFYGEDGTTFDIGFSTILHSSGGGPFVATDVLGGAFLSINGNRFTIDRLIDPNVVQNSSYLFYGRVAGLVVGDLTLEQAVDGVAVDSDGVATVITLPPLDVVPFNHELWVKWARNAAGSVSVEPAAGENIDDAAGAVALPVLGDFARFSADQASDTWWRIG